MRTIAGTTWSVEDAREYIKARIKVDENGCWIWRLSVNCYGYGNAQAPAQFVGQRRTFIAHRMSFEAFRFHPKNLLVCHACDIRACCNPEHLFLGTHADNAGDMVAKGRQARTPDEVRDAILRHGGTQREVARLFGVSKSYVGNLRRALSVTAYAAGAGCGAPGSRP